MAPVWGVISRSKQSKCVDRAAIHVIPYFDHEEHDGDIENCVSVQLSTLSGDAGTLPVGVVALSRLQTVTHRYKSWSLGYVACGQSKSGVETKIGAWLHG